MVKEGIVMMVFGLVFLLCGLIGGKGGEVILGIVFFVFFLVLGIVIIVIGMA